MEKRDTSMIVHHHFHCNIVKYSSCPDYSTHQALEEAYEDVSDMTHLSKSSKVDLVDMSANFGPDTALNMKEMPMLVFNLINAMAIILSPHYATIVNALKT